MRINHAIKIKEESKSNIDFFQKVDSGLLHRAVNHYFMYLNKFDLHEVSQEIGHDHFDSMSLLTLIEQGEVHIGLERDVFENWNKYNQNIDYPPVTKESITVVDGGEEIDP
jgi:hypothetical protein